MSQHTHKLTGLGNIPMGLGGAAISGEGGGYGFGTLSEESAESLLKSAWDQGIRLFDTAPIYGFGLSEERMGRYLPADAFIVTKGGVHWHESKRVNMTNDPRIIEEMLLESFKRLKREVIDLYMIHWPDARVDIRQPLEVLKRYQDQQRIKHIGLCNTSASDLNKAQEICDIVALQSEFNLFNDQNFNSLPASNTFKMGWGTLDKGILSGRVDMKRTFDKDDCRSWAPWWNKKEVQAKVERVQKFLPLLERHGVTIKHFALQYSLTEGVDMPLIGSKSLNDLKEVMQFLGSPLEPQVMATLKKAWKEAK